LKDYNVYILSVISRCLHHTVAFDPTRHYHSPEVWNSELLGMSILQSVLRTTPVSSSR